MSTVIRWNPLRELAAMQSAMDRIFDESWHDARPNFYGNTLPIDVLENDDVFTIIANIPGVNPDNLNINVHDGVLSIAVEIPQPEYGEGVKALMQERFYGSLARRFNLSHEVDVEAVEASYDEGVLTLTLPKAEVAKPRQITIKANHRLESGG